MSGFDINFPLVLVVLTAASGLLWLLDSIFLAPGRRQALARLRRDYPQWETEGSEHQRKYQARAGKSAREPLAVEYAKAFFPVLAFVLVLRSFLVEPFQIPSPSMAPTLQKGDFILVNKYAYGIRLPLSRAKVADIGQPQRGDVMVFFPPHRNKTYFIKRVIGLPGDHLRYDGEQLFINGQAAALELLAQEPPLELENSPAPQWRIYRETLSPSEGEDKNEAAHHIQEYTGKRSAPFSLQVKPGHYFMMGDNRDNSQDSRFWGQVPERDLVGRAFAIWMHWDSFFSLPSFSRAGRIR